MFREVGEVGRDKLLHLTQSGLVEAITDNAETGVHERNVQRLSTHQRILLKIIRKSGEVAAGELHGEYEEQAQNPKSKPMRRRYL